MIHPILYEVGYHGKIFNNSNFASYILRGLLHSLWIWGVTTFSLQYSDIIDDLGHVGGFWFTSITTFTSIVLMVNIQIS